ncbi:hypothetical protein Gohar_004498 [Gossypium harknessii]|uniref:Aminotransferase-like plant mobile domain-containing protein n=1 Tax=Gossypium harknessii TaxID=34285 RepID=A0A7J9H510_9ROSI|nr:hypothetical protein [Gossypium harknessii]
MDTCERQDSYTWLTGLGGLNWVPHLLVLWWKNGDSRHNFHLPYGECTITLEDIGLQLDLSVNGEVITAPVVNADWSETFEQLLGKVPNKFRGSQIEVGWLEDYFKQIEAFTSGVEKEKFACAFILRMTGGLLMPDKSQNMVHLRWLLLLVDLKEVGQFSWGSMVLATLYREMCQGSENSRMCPGQIFGQSQHLTWQCAIDHFCNDRDAQIQPSDVTVRVYTTYFAATLEARLPTQDRFAGKTRQRLANIR